MTEALQDHYDGTNHDPYLNKNPHEAYRPISVIRATLSHVTQIRPNLAQDISIVSYIAQGMTDLSIYMPIYQGLTNLPTVYQNVTSQADDNSLFWKFRKLEVLVFKNYPKFASAIKQQLAGFQNNIGKRQFKMEQDYQSFIDASDHSEALQQIQSFTDETISSMSQLLNSLVAELISILKEDAPTNAQYTTLIEELEKLYHFEGA